MKYARHLVSTPQSIQIPGKNQVKNEAGGFVFQIDDFDRLKRFLILGSEGGSFYSSEAKLTLENASCVSRCLDNDYRRTIRQIVEISDKGLAPKNDPAIFAIAMATCHANKAARVMAWNAVPEICRIGTHMFQFVEARQACGGGFGRRMRLCLFNYFNRPDIVLQALKYQQRNGWAHRDLLRLGHPKTGDENRAAIFNAICRPEQWNNVADPLAKAYCKLKEAKTAKEVAKIVRDASVPRELVPTQWLTEAEVWGALLPHMGLNALIRNLANMTRSGLVAPLSDATAAISTMLNSAGDIKKSRLHPFNILLAMATYGQGHGFKGGNTWAPVPSIMKALNTAFELSFGNIIPTKKRTLLAIDVSGSMGSPIGDSPLTCAMAAACMAMVTARTEPFHHIVGFSTDIRELGITANDSLQEVCRKTNDRNFGGTNTSAAIDWAEKNKIPVDVFVTYTDNATWAGDRHTCQAIQSYRKTHNKPTKLAVVGFTSTAYSVADTQDPLSMDFVGLDSSLPQALNAFVEM